jgi:hypothetical protein
MCQNTCKECPWSVRNDWNDKIIGHSIKHNKKHNCHMVPPEKRGMLWDDNPKFQCVGNKNNLEISLDSKIKQLFL